MSVRTGQSLCRRCLTWCPSFTRIFLPSRPLVAVGRKCLKGPISLWWIPFFFISQNLHRHQYHSKPSSPSTRIHLALHLRSSQSFAKALMSTTRVRLDLTFDVVVNSSLACVETCSNLLDYVMEPLCVRNPNIHALLAVSALVLHTDWTKWTYVIPILVQCIETYWRQHNSSNSDPD